MKHFVNKLLVASIVVIQKQVCLGVTLTQKSSEGFNHVVGVASMVPDKSLCCEEGTFDELT